MLTSFFYVCHEPRIRSESGFQVLCVYVHRGVERLSLAPACSAEHHPAAAGLRLGGSFSRVAECRVRLNTPGQSCKQAKEVQSLVQKLLMIYVLAGYADSAQNVMGSTLRGVGHLNSSIPRAPGPSTLFRPC